MDGFSFMLLSITKLNATTTANKFIYLYSSTLIKILSVFILLGLVITPAFSAKLEKSIHQETVFKAKDFYHALVAEMNLKFGEQSLALDSYYKLSNINSDPAIAKKVTELATVTGQIVKALDGAKRWVEIEPDSLEANQYLALLYLRNNHFKSSAIQLMKIRKLIEKSSEYTDTIGVTLQSKDQFLSSESLTFIGALLAAEAHHEKAYSVFKLYIKDYLSKSQAHKTYLKQQKLIHAQLAMKAKAYTDVISSLEGLTGLVEKNRVDAIVLQAKALHKLHQNSKAIELLNSIKNHSETKDSHRLELVRLLVLDKQKSLALPVLKTLVSKHSKNFDLLKSLIALQIDQSKLSDVELNIALLISNDRYLNEANYFSGEFAEKLGQQEKALASYEKVEAGSYQKNAHKKRIALTKQIYGQEKLNTVFLNEQKNAVTLTDKAYWVKLQADELFETKQYQKALILYNKAITLAPDKVRYRYKRGLVNERIGKLNNAELDFNYVLAKRENDTDTLNALGYMLSVHTQRFVEAKRHIDKAFMIKPNDPLILDSLGFVLYKTGELDKAEQFLRKAFRLMKKPEVASHLITVLAKSNQHQEAKIIFLEMQRIYPDSPSLKSVSHHLP